MSTRRRPRSQRGPLLSGVVVILAGFGIALVEAFGWPKGAIWIVVAVAVLLISAIRYLTHRG